MTCELPCPLALALQAAQGDTSSSALWVIDVNYDLAWARTPGEDVRELNQWLLCLKMLPR